MKTTMNKSEKKSKSLRNRIKLTCHPDFWKFYQLNKDDVHYIIECTVNQYGSPDIIMDREDIIQQVLLDLAQSDFLKAYKSSRAHLATYFTHKVRGYVSHVIEIPIKRARVIGKHYPSGKKLFSELNNIPVPPSGETCPSDYEDLEEYISHKTFLEKLAEGIPEKAQTVLKGVLEGYTQKAIAGKLGCTAVYVGVLKRDITHRARKLWGK